MMRELGAADLGMLLSVFAVLLIFFGIDFRISRKDAAKNKGLTRAFAVLSVLGEMATAVALILTWVSLFSPAAWEAIDTRLVFGAGSVAVGCAVILTVEVVVKRLTSLWKKP